MKKMIILGGLLCLVLQGKAFAGQSDDFTYDRSAIEQEMQGLNLLEDFLNHNPGTTVDGLTGNTLPLPPGSVKPGDWPE